MVFKLAEWGADPVSLFFILLFLPLSLFAYYVIPSIYRREALVAVSILYIAAVSPWQILLIFVSIGSSYLIMGQLQTLSSEAVYPRRMLMGLCIGLNIFFWIIFGVMSWNGGLTYLIGGSVFPLLTLDTALSLYRKPQEPIPPLMNFLAYSLFFPRLYLGPLESYEEFWKNGISREQGGKNLWSGLKKFIRGAFQYQFLGVRLFQLAGKISALRQEEITTLSTWTLILVEAFGIYHTLGGFSQMAMGMGEMFFVDLPKDSGSVFRQNTVVETLKAFHKTSLQFFTRNVYVPLLKFSKNFLFKGLVTVVTGGLIGLWLDFNLGMLFWGMILGFGVYIQGYLNAKKKISSGWNQVITKVTLLAAFVLMTLGHSGENWGLAGSLLPHKNTLFVNNQIIFLIMSQWVVLVIGFLLATPKILELPKVLLKFLPEKVEKPLEVVTHLFLGFILTILII